MTYEEKLKGYVRGRIKLDSINIKECMCFIRDRIWVSFHCNGKKYDLWLIRADDVDWLGRKVFIVDSHGFTSLMVGTEKGERCFHNMLEMIIMQFENNSNEPYIIIIDDIKYEAIAELVETE